MIPPRTFLLLLASMLSASSAAALNLTAITPADGATGVCADTPVRLTFDAEVRLGAVGTVQLVDATTGEVVDSADLADPDRKSTRLNSSH